MSDSHRKDGPSAGKANRRSVLASLDSGSEFERPGTAGGSMDRREVVADVLERPSGPISNASWILKHSSKKREKGIGDERHYYDTDHNLAYLGAQWVDYGNPNPETDPSGAWKHTFVLNAHTVDIVEEPDISDSRTDGTKMDSDRIGDIFPGDKIRKGYVEVDVAEELDRENGDDETGRENVAVSLRRDGDLFHFLGPAAIAELLNTEVTVECKDPCDTGGPGEMPTCTNNCVEEHAGETTMGKLFTGTNEFPRRTFDDYQQAIAAAEEEQERAVTQAIAFELTKMGLSTVVGRLLCTSRPVACVFLLTGVELLDWALAQVDEEPETTFTRGFHKEFVPDDFQRTGLGHTMMFDVYVTPDEDKEGTVTVKSQHDTHLLNHDPLERELGFEEIRERARLAGFNPLPQWELEFPGAPPPTGDDLTYPSDEKYQPEILPPGDGSQTNVEVKFAGSEEYNRNPPAAEFLIEPEEPTEDQTVTFDASLAEDITESRGHEITEYHWLIWRVDTEYQSVELAQGPLFGKKQSRTLPPDRYAVELTVSTESGLHDTERKYVTVKTRSTEEAIRGDDGILESEELLEARDLWVAGEAVPGTGGKEMDGETLQELTTEYCERWGLFDVETEWGVK